jgi:glyoxylase-like metal-dependent hydrolase (beta-lactamase superfamily II)/8-oxo-dGTP pyrophosphatase MutT (NUDIX family)
VNANDGVVDSASTLLLRSWEASDVFLVLRAAGQRAFAATYVFPGGRVDPSDSQIEVLDPATGVAPASYGAAARELFEEAGVLVATTRDGSPVDPARLAELRRGLLDGRVAFADVLARLDAVVDGRSLAALGVKTTPPFSTRRFRNRFFAACLPAGQAPGVLPTPELDSGCWMPASAAVERFEAGEILLAPPVLLLLERLAAGAGGGAREALAALAGFDDSTLAGTPVRIRFGPDVLTLPGRTPTLPPATHTNAYILGRERLLVVDPATPHADDQDQLLRLLASLAAEGRRIEAIVPTHHHHDHVGAVDRVARETGAPVWAHEVTAHRIRPVHVRRLLADGDAIDLGSAGVVRVLHTPGHDRGHVCLYMEQTGALVAGDMVSTVSTILIDPPEGDLLDYVASLRRLLDLPARMLYPAHGPPTSQVRPALEHYLAHRYERVRKTLAALDARPRAIEDLVRVVYADVEPATHGLASRNLLASLLALEREGRAERDAGGCWRRGAGGRADGSGRDGGSAARPRGARGG